MKRHTSASSFANTSGGDLLIGVEADEGVPNALPGVEIASIDKEKLRLEQILANGLEPRLPRVDVHPVQVAEGRYVLVARVLRSWVAPHRVRKNDKFYGRNSAGRYPLDVGELRTVFTQSETMSERIRSFRADRIARVYGRETPVPLRDGGCMILHLLPLAAFTGQPVLDLSDYYGRSWFIVPVGASGWSGRINIDGYVTFTGPSDERSRAYTQLFRSGIVEAATTLYQDKQGVILSHVGYEQELLDALAHYAKAIADLSVPPPLFVFLSFVGVRGCRLSVNTFRWPDDVRPLREDTLLLPEIVLEREEFEPQRVLRPLFDMVWNAFGFAGSLNYDASGNWVARE